jgi:hypothetical protein
MTVNQYFSHFSQLSEANLLQDLVNETISIHGIDTYYLPRTVSNENKIYHEAGSASFNAAYPFEVFVKNVDGWTGDGKFMSKFGIEIRDEITFTISKTRFAESMAAHTSTGRPNEGDIFYFPLNGKLYQITYVNYEPTFYAMGKLQTYDVTCSLFEYNNESFDTGIAAIDDKYNEYSTDMKSYHILSEDNFVILSENGVGIIQDSYDLDAIDPTADNEEFHDEADKITDWSETDPFTEHSY